MKVGVVLSGGGVRGAAHIGVLRALEESGIPIDVISGTSSGSIVACLYSAGYTPDEIEDIFFNVCRKSGDVKWLSFLPVFLNFVMIKTNKLHSKTNIIDIDLRGIIFFLINLLLMRKDKIDGFLKGDALESVINKYLDNKKVNYLRDTNIPLAIPTVDINNAQTVMFVSSKHGLKDTKHCIHIDDALVWEAVRASSAFPVIFKPKIFRGRRLVDGGLKDNVPVDIVRQMGANKVLAVNLGYSGQTKDEIDNILEIAAQSVSIMSYQLFKYKYNGANYVLNPEIYDVKLFETSKIKECIDRGYKVTKREMYDIKNALNIRNMYVS